MSSRISVIAALSWIALAGCGARSGLEEASGAGGASQAASSASQSSSASSASSASSSSSTGGSACTWGFGPVVDGVSGPLAVDGDHLLRLGFGSHKDKIGSLSFALQALGPLKPLPVGGVGTLTAGFGHAAVVVRDDVPGCNSVALATDGTATNGPMSIGSGADCLEQCFSTTATPSGFLVLVGTTCADGFPISPINAAVLAADGSLVAAKPGILPSPASGPTIVMMTTAVLDDGSIIVVWSLDVDQTLHAVHLAASGDPIGSPVTVGGLAYYPAAVSLGSSVLLAWNQGASKHQAIVTAVLDASLNLGPTHAVVPPPSTAVVVGLVDGGPGPGKLLAWKTEQEGTIVGQWIGADGTPIGAPFTSELQGDHFWEYVVGTPVGPVVAGAPGASRVLCQ